jgi:hypothetical protein
VADAGLANKGSRDGPATTWYFAEGYTGISFQEYLTVFDPGATATVVRVGFLGTNGPVPGTVRLDIKPFDQAKIDVRAAYLRLIDCGLEPNKPARDAKRCVSALAGVSIGMVVTSTKPVVAERALYWGAGTDEFKPGFDVSMGATTPAAVMHFAYVSTLNGDQAYLSVVNPPEPSAKCASGRAKCASQVQVSAYSDTGSRMGFVNVTVPAGARATLQVSRLVGAGVYALSVRSSVPVVGELAQYVGGSPGTGSHPGLDMQGSRGGTLLIGSAFDATGAGTLLRVFNPTVGRIVVHVTGLSTAGTFYAQSYQIAEHATLELQLKVPPLTSSTTARQSARPIAVAVSCSGPCVAAAMAGARGWTVPLPPASPPEAWGSQLN